MELGVPAESVDLILQCGSSQEEGSSLSKRHSPPVPWSELGLGLGQRCRIFNMDHVFGLKK